MSSVEVVKAFLRRIEEINPKLNAVVQLDRQGALTPDTMIGSADAIDSARCTVCRLKEDLDAAFSYSEVYNYVGSPAVVVRGGTSDEGLPIGVQIVARPWREDVALAIAYRLEKELGGWRPPVIPA